MKRIMHGFLSVSIVALLQSAAFAQITITTSNLSNLFGAGTSELIYSNHDSSETMNVGTPSSSTSQSWSLPAFTVIDSSRINNVLPSSTPYASDFPGATYAETFSQIDSGLTLHYYAFIDLSNDSLYFTGTVEHMTGSSSGHAIDTAIVQHVMRFAFHLPVALGDMVNGAPDTSIYGPGVMQVTTTSSTYDAYGTLTLPNGSFQALRSRQVTTFKMYSGGTLVNSSTSYSLVWITREGHQLTVGIDSGATSGTVKLNSISVSYSITTPTLVKKNSQTPGQFNLEQNYPNPFNPTTVISYQLPAAGNVTLKVYDILGNEIATLVNGRQDAGNHSAIFSGANLPSGVYLYKLQAGTFSQTKKLMLIK